MQLTSFLATDLEPGAKPLGSVLVAHGFGEHHRRYDDFIEALNRAGYDVWAFDFPGHGRSPGKRATADVGDLIVQHLEARREVYRRARSHNMFLFGHSMGGLITLASALLSPAKLNAVAVTGPALCPLPKMPAALVPFGQVAGRLLPRLKTVKIDDSQLSHDPAVAEAYAEDPLVYDGKVPLLTGASMIRQGKAVLENAGALRVPVLILHGDQDALADVAGSQEFAEEAGSLVDLRVKAGDYHELLNELDREAYYQEIVDWYGLW